MAVECGLDGAGLANAVAAPMNWHFVTPGSLVASRSSTIVLSATEAAELTRIAKRQSARAAAARRARLILLLAAGHTWAAIGERLHCPATYIALWNKRFVANRIAGLFSRNAGRSPTTLTHALEARIMEWSVKRRPADGSRNWSTRKLARQLGVSHMMIARVWRKHALRPRPDGIEDYMVLKDPAFKTKGADIIGLYLRPPQHAAVFCVDATTGIRALDRYGPVFSASHHQAKYRDSEYCRYGAHALHTALSSRTGDALGGSAARNTSAEFVAFLTDIVVNQPHGGRVCVIADNLPVRQSAALRDFLVAHPRVRVHFAFTYSSWLNQVEQWFSKIEHDSINDGLSMSGRGLTKKLMRRMRYREIAPKSLKWKCFNFTTRSTSICGADQLQLCHDPQEDQLDFPTGPARGRRKSNPP